MLKFCLCSLAKKFKYQRKTNLIRNIKHSVLRRITCFLVMFHWDKVCLIKNNNFIYILLFLSKKLKKSRGWDPLWKSGNLSADFGKIYMCPHKKIFVALLETVMKRLWKSSFRLKFNILEEMSWFAWLLH